MSVAGRRRKMRALHNGPAWWPAPVADILTPIPAISGRRGRLGIRLSHGRIATEIMLAHERTECPHGPCYPRRWRVCALRGLGFATRVRGQDWGSHCQVTRLGRERAFAYC